MIFGGKFVAVRLRSRGSGLDGKLWSSDLDSMPFRAAAVGRHVPHSSKISCEWGAFILCYSFPWALFILFHASFGYRVKNYHFLKELFLRELRRVNFIFRNRI